MLDKSTAIGKIDLSNGRHSYVFKCSFPDCSKTIRVRQDSLKKCKGLCKIHGHRKKPFESIFNYINNTCVNHKDEVEFKLTYREFLSFTAIKNCHYCGELIPWQAYPTVGGQYLSSAYFLDRKDNRGPYSQDNCVVCCTSCNRIKGDRFSYEEFLRVGQIISDIKKERLVSS